jgi:hypothetical protein
MAYRFPPQVNALKKCMGWFPGGYNASLYAPASPLDGGVTIGKVVAPKSPPSFPPPSPLSLFATLGHLGPSVKFIAGMGALFGLLFFVLLHARNSRKKLPSRPRRIPIIGNLSQLSDKKWLFSRECKEHFGGCRTFYRKQSADGGAWGS